MKDIELKERLIKAFEEKLKKQISEDRNVKFKGENIAIVEVLNVKAFLESDLNILELLSNEKANLRFTGYIDFSIKVENGTMDKKYNHFNPINVNGMYLEKKKEFVFDERILFSLIN